SLRTTLGELWQAADELDAVARRALELGRRDLRCGALIGLANIDSKQGRPTSARTRLAEAESIADELGDRRPQIRAMYEPAKLLGWFDASPAAAVPVLRRALALAEEEQDRALRIEGHMRLGTLLLNLGELARAEAEFRCGAALAEADGSRRDEARIASILAGI